MAKSTRYNPQIVVLNDVGNKSKSIAAQLELELVDTLPVDQALYLSYHNGQLSLCSKTKKVVFKISVDFVSSRFQFRRQRISPRSEPLLRAIGCSQKKMLNVVDATAGLGRDSFLIANCNCNVVMLEQSPIVAALLEDGLQRAADHAEVKSIISHMTLIKQNAIDFFQSTENLFDVVYLDPMFPPRTKSAKVKKEMQLLHALLGPSEFEIDLELLNIALQKVAGRVVVKRPKSAEFLGNRKPSYSLNTKAMRYDVYVKNSFHSV